MPCLACLSLKKNLVIFISERLPRNVANTVLRMVLQGCRVYNGRRHWRSDSNVDRLPRQLRRSYGNPVHAHLSRHISVDVVVTLTDVATYLLRVLGRMAQKEEKRCMATLLTDDSFLPGVDVLVYSFRKWCKSDCDVVVVVSEQVTKTTRFVLKRKGVRVVPVPTIKGAKIRRDGESKKHWESAELTKLNLWNLVEYAKVVYIDADCLVMAPVDELFEIDIGANGIAAAPDIFVRAW